jgi:hypothetical protein
VRWRGFQVRVLVLTLGLVAAGVVATTLAALTASRENALSTAGRELQLGGTLFEWMPSWSSRQTNGASPRA